MTALRVLVADLMSGTVKDEIPFTTFDHGKALCRPGAFTGSIPVSHPKCTRDNLSVNNTAVYVERDGVIQWGGILWTAAVSYRGANPALVVSGEGFWSYFRRRKIRARLVYTQVDQLQIVRSLVAYAQSQPGSFSVALDPKTCGVLRDRPFYAFERKPLGEAVEELAKVINGFDFDIDSAYNSGGNIVNTLRFFYPQQGSSVPVGLDLGATVEGMDVTEDGTPQATVVDALGLGEGASAAINSAEEPPGSGYPRLEASVAYKDVKDRALLGFYAAARLGQVRRPVIRLSNVQLADTADAVGVGDVARVVLDDSYFDLNQLYRVVETKSAVSEDGLEKRFVTLAETDTFGG